MKKALVTVFGVLLIVLSVVGMMYTFTIPACVPFWFVLYLVFVFSMGVIAGVYTLSKFRRV